MSSELFAKNVEAFALDNPDHSATLSKLDCSYYSFISPPQQELNLKIGEDFLCSQEGPLDEANEWFSHLNLEGVDVIYVYGIGLGYYYQAAKAWLNEDKKRALIFFEDDLVIIHRFLETTQATGLLGDSQVRLLYFRNLDLDWKVFDWIIWDHLIESAIVTALRSYERLKQANLEVLSLRFAYEIADKRNRMLEDLEYGALLFNNYYRNLLVLPQAHLGRGLCGKFSKIPAIICGAGPSLEKHLSILPTLQDRAIIFGVGSSMNILNAQGFLPHFGASIDPNPEQFQRLMMNQAYEVPFFYHNRAMHEGLSFLHGPKLFMPGSGAYETADWFEEKLSIPNRPIIQEGYSVVNFALSTAFELGCDPIIFIGIDMSDKDGHHYPPGVESHPLYKVPKRLDEQNVGKIHTKDIFGDPVTTNWLWLAEGNWISLFADTHPEVKIINASEGGIGIHNIPNLTLKEVIQQHLNQTYDLRGLVHESIQAAMMPTTVTKDIVFDLLEEFQDSLKKCAEAYQDGNHVKDVEKEPGYRYLLKDFEESYLRYLHKQTSDAERLRKQKNDPAAKLVQDKLERLKNAFLYDVATAHFIYIKNTLVEASHYLTDLNQCIDKNISREKLTKTTLVDGLRQGSAELYYRSGAIYGKLHYKNNYFEGAQTYYYANGTLKTELTYHNRLLDGQAKLYYPSGQLKMEIAFKNGIRHGIEKQWYGNGQLFIEVNYILGKSFGSAYCWLADGTLAKVISF